MQGIPASFHLTADRDVHILSIAIGAWLYMASVLAFPLLNASLTFAEDLSSGSGVWKSMTPAPIARTEVAAAAVGKKIYLLGGFSEPTVSNMKDLSITTLVEEYDTVTDRWSSKAPLPQGLHHVGIGVIGDRIYVIGGFTQ